MLSIQLVGYKTTTNFLLCVAYHQAIATGLLTQKEHPIDKIYISRRSESKSSALAEKFSDKVVICDNSQEIADKCETLFLCVLPDQEEEVLKSLHLKEETTLVSLVVSTQEYAMNKFNFGEHKTSSVISELFSLLYLSLQATWQRSFKIQG